MMVFNDSLNFKFMTFLSRRPLEQKRGMLTMEDVAVLVIRKGIKTGQWDEPGMLTQACEEVCALRGKSITKAELGGQDISKNGDQTKAWELIGLLPLARLEWRRLANKENQTNIEENAMKMMDAFLKTVEELETIFGSPPEKEPGQDQEELIDPASTSAEILGRITIIREGIRGAAASEEPDPALPPSRSAL